MAVAGRVLIVGGGLTGAAVACRLSGLPLEVECWDRARKPGGRMTTHRSGNSQVDLGPQFITRKLGGESALFDGLVNSGLLTPVVKDIQLPQQEEDIETEQMSECAVCNDERVPVSFDDNICFKDTSNLNVNIMLSKPVNYIPPKGSQSIVEHLWKKSQVEPLSHHFLHELNMCGSQWKAINKTHQKALLFDAVILTMPIPQYIDPRSPEGGPKGNYISAIQQNGDVYKSLQSVEYCSSFSLGIFYRTVQCLGIDWKHKYFPDSRIIRFICQDAWRRGCGEQEPTTITVQSQRNWARHNRHLTRAQAQPILMAELERLVPGLPTPDDVLTHRWTYSQTDRPYPGQVGAATLVDIPLLVAAGDSFCQASVEGCLISADQAAKIVQSNFNL